MISPRTKAILVPNLIGNCPDWDRIRAIADAHGLQVIEDSCDALGAKLRGTPTGTRSDISVTSFALAHVITAAATGGMVLLDDDDLIDRCVLLRRWGRRSETQFYGSKKGDKRFFTEVDGIEYDNLFIFDEVGWNFEPSEISAAFGVVQLRKLPLNLARRQRNFDLLSAFFGTYPDVFVLPRQTAELETGWHMFPVLIRPESGIRRAEFQEHMEGNGVDTRMVWTGNVTRQPAFANGAAPRPRRRVAERRPGDGAGADPAAEPRSRRRRHRVPVRHRRSLPERARPHARPASRRCLDERAVHRPACDRHRRQPRHRSRHRRASRGGRGGGGARRPHRRRTTPTLAGQPRRRLRLGCAEYGNPVSRDRGRPRRRRRPRSHRARGGGELGGSDRRSSSTTRPRRCTRKRRRCR